jgi:hypothetical protein
LAQDHPRVVTRLAVLEAPDATVSSILDFLAG